MSATSFMLAFPWFLFAVTVLCWHGSFSAGCTQSEREALLQFKLGLKDPSNRLSSWGGDADCCGWSGVICDNLTSHVLELHLRTLSEKEYYAFNATGDYDKFWERSAFRGKISKSLLNLKNLKHLDLSNNNFEGIPIPKFLGSMGSLRYLNLCGAEFGGMIPHQLGNLSNLQYLNIGDIYTLYDKYVESLHWLSNLTSLEFLDLSFVNLSKALDWLDVMNKLPSLVELHLSGSSLNHKAPPLPNVNFSSLSVLDLSMNNFDESSVSNWIFQITKLSSLDLSSNLFFGSVPVHLQNITSLRELNLSDNEFNSSMAIWLHDFSHLEALGLFSNNLQDRIPSAIGNLTSLNILDLELNQFEGAIPSDIGNLTSLNSLDLSNNTLEGSIPSAIGNLTSLYELDLSDNNLAGEIPSAIGNLISLNRLDLSYNKLEGAIPSAIGNLISLNRLDLSYNKLEGAIPSAIGNLISLSRLALSYNELEGVIPVTLGELTSLTSVDLSYNKLNGSLPICFGALEKLEEVHFSHNSLEGEVSQFHFTNLTNLKYFDGSHNQLLLRVNPDWIPPFQLLEHISLQSWDVGPQVPTWLRSLKHLKYLDLSNSKISSTLPIWFHDLSSRLYYFNLSHNQMHGEIPYLSIDDSDYSFIDLSSNKFDGQLPYITSHPAWIDLSNNLFSGSISIFLCDRVHELKAVILNLGKNLLSGEIPDCWMNWRFLGAIVFNDNYFSGNIPKSIGTLSYLWLLNLRNNNLSGEIPLSLQHCSELTVLDIGENELGGDISVFLEKQHFSNMVIFNLRENKFHGHIPKEFCRMTSLRILDLANNNLSGKIPTCVDNFSEMVYETYDMGGLISIFIDDNGSFYGSSSIMKKGQMIEYSTILNFVRSMDLSNNKLSGDIPKTITRLEALQSLNLSHNLLSGRIPEEIGNMQKLESLDFSQNQLVGEIPPSMSSLTFLSYLNLSNNKLSGIIPTSTQLQSFDPSSFSGNKLCGPPLTKNCSVDGATHPIGTERGEDDKGPKSFYWFYFYVSIAPGFVVGFWVVVGPLVFNRRWRHLYFNLLDDLWDKIMVWYYLNVVRVVRGHGF
ncbi:hypothetical protein P3X46_031829 [Hevea brasiliensis]|uniref:Leucine-rich repeat-containing N-terminal plant-type domain-containing protein n=2 Tax=Hevea brasiliensis TaxID=3981 RepID=A0ABQ9KMW3_HEVBR|nr:hypothetical protein P3X46_031829 [Hevea brasiliensis]